MVKGELPFLDKGKLAQLSLKPRLEVNDAAAAIAAAEAGNGITSTLCYMVGGAMRAGRLVPVLEPFWPPSTPVHIVYPHSRLLAAKVRAFVDWSAPRLSNEVIRLSAQHAA